MALEISSVLDVVIFPMKSQVYSLRVLQLSSHLRKPGGSCDLEGVYPASAGASATPAPGSVKPSHRDPYLSFCF